jgi:DNA-binding XRE family transcriptional regulator
MSKAAKIKQPTQTSLDDLPEIDVTKARILGRGLRKDRKLPLRALREAADKTQGEIASLAGMDQSEISRVEQRDDLRLSTLRRYARALDAEIEIIAVLPTGHRIKLDL